MPISTIFLITFLIGFLLRLSGRTERSSWFASISIPPVCITLRDFLSRTGYGMLNWPIDSIIGTFIGAIIGCLGVLFASLFLVWRNRHKQPAEQSHSQHPAGSNRWEELDYSQLIGMLRTISQLAKYTGIIIVGLMLPLLLISGVVFLATPRYTAPTRIIFIDQSNNSPVKGLKVKCTWLGFEGIIAVGGSWAYHTEEFTTAADGSVILPKVKRPFPVNFLIYQRDHMDIRINLRSWNYIENIKSTWCAFGPFKIQGNENESQIKLLPASNLDAQLQALDDNWGAFGKEFWQEGISAIIAEHGLAALSTWKLSIIADTCAEYNGASCKELDEEVLRRSGYNTEKNYSARKAALRLGIVTPDMAQWFKLWEERNSKGQPGPGVDQQEAAAIRQLLEKSKQTTKSSSTRH